MNPRALALGAVVGFVIAFSPSCSPAKCGPQNCDGCCDATKGCVKKPNNNNNTTCGSSGGTCSDCAASGAMCNPATSTCTSSGGTGGGSGGTGGGTGGGMACDGCMLPSGLCNPSQISKTSVTNCGIGGVQCVPCSSGQSCVNGACQIVDSGVMATIGSACSTDSDCAAIPLTAQDMQYQVAVQCKKTALDLQSPTGQGVPYPQGYCTKRCGFENGSCGAGNTCRINVGFLGEYENLCFKNCTQTSECRNNYACIPTTPGFCFPFLEDGGLSIVDAGPGRTAQAGAACTSDTECQPPGSGSCVQELMMDGGPSGFPGGACTAECGAVAAFNYGDAWCGTQGNCNPTGFEGPDGKGPIVFWSCEVACGADAGTCRSGYVCDNGQFPVCVPNCTNAGINCGMGRTCNTTTGLCQ